MTSHNQLPSVTECDQLPLPQVLLMVSILCFKIWPHFLGLLVPPCFWRRLTKGVPSRMFSLQDVYLKEVSCGGGSGEILFSPASAHFSSLPFQAADAQKASDPT